MEKLKVKSKEEQNIEKGLETALIGFKVIDDVFAPTTTLCFQPSQSTILENFSDKAYEEAQPTESTRTGDISKAFEEEKKQQTEPDFKNEAEQAFQGKIKTSTFPQSAHGLIIARKSEHEAPRWGSGMLVGSDLVVTAAHNVYFDEGPVRKRYPFIKFIPGANGDQAPYGEIEVDFVFASENYINNNKGETSENGVNESDCALLILKMPIGREAGYFGLYLEPTTDDDLFEEKEFSFFGFAGGQSQEVNEGELKQIEEKAMIFDFTQKNELIRYHVPADPECQIGTAVVYTGPRGQFHVAGVHIRGSQKTKTGSWITERKFKQFCD